MVAFFPNGSVQSKVNICSCRQCLIGNFTECPSELGKIKYAGVPLIGSDSESDDDSDIEDCEPDEDFEDETESYELRSESVFAIEKGSTIALYSPSTSIELFFLCTVADFGIASEELKDKNKHIIKEGEKFIKGRYLEKTREKKGFVYYKLLKDEVFIHVLSPLVPIYDDLALPVTDYLWLADSIGVPNTY